MPAYYKETRHSSFDIGRATDPTKVKITNTKFLGAGIISHNQIEDLILYAFLQTVNFPKTNTPVIKVQTEDIMPASYDADLAFETTLADGVYKIKYNIAVDENVYGQAPYLYNQEFDFVWDTNFVRLARPVTEPDGFAATTFEIFEAYTEEKKYVKYSEIYNCFQEKLEYYICLIKEGKRIDCNTQSFKDFLYLQKAIHWLEAICEVGVNTMIKDGFYIAENGTLTKEIATVNVTGGDNSGNAPDFWIHLWETDSVSELSEDELYISAQKIIDNCKTICCCC